jgi:HSP90 family molecular chaperone
MKVVYVDNKKNITSNTISVDAETGTAMVQFFVDGELELTRPVAIPEEAQGDITHDSFKKTVQLYEQRLVFGAHIGLKQDNTIKHYEQ